MVDPYIFQQKVIQTIARGENMGQKPVLGPVCKNTIFDI